MKVDFNTYQLRPVRRSHLELEQGHVNINPCFWMSRKVACVNLLNWVRRLGFGKDLGPAAGKSSDRIYLFVHLPKCAGTSLLKMLSHVGDRRCITVAETNSKSESRDFVRTEAGRLGDELTLIMGRDVLYGMHDVSRKIPFYFTFLRDPISRYVSQYSFYVDGTRDPKHRAYQIGMERVMDRGRLLSLTEFAGRGSDKNMLTRALADANYSSDSREKWWHTEGESAFELAKSMLAKMSFIGLVGHFDRDSATIFDLLGIRPPPMRLNASHASAPEFENLLDGETFELIQANNRQDLELYELASRRADELRGRIDE